MVLVDEVATRRAPTLEELKDTLYEQGAADELVFDLALRERSAVSGGGSPPPEPRLRAIAQMFLSWLAQAMKLSDATWFSAVALIDAYSTHIEGGLDARRLAGACVASVRLLQKLNCSALGIPAKSLVECTSNFSDWMRKMGHQCEEVTSEYLDDEERAIVRAMHWQVVIPTLESWLSLYVQRWLRTRFRRKAASACGARAAGARPGGREASGRRGRRPQPDQGEDGAQAGDEGWSARRAGGVLRRHAGHLGGAEGRLRDGVLCGQGGCAGRPSKRGSGRQAEQVKPPAKTGASGGGASTQVQTGLGQSKNRGDGRLVLHQHAPPLYKGARAQFPGDVSAIDRG